MQSNTITLLPELIVLQLPSSRIRPHSLTNWNGSEN